MTIKILAWDNESVLAKPLWYKCADDFDAKFGFTRENSLFGSGSDKERGKAYKKLLSVPLADIEDLETLVPEVKTAGHRLHSVKNLLQVYSVGMISAYKFWGKGEEDLVYQVFIDKTCEEKSASLDQHARDVLLSQPGKNPF